MWLSVCWWKWGCEPCIYLRKTTLVDTERTARTDALKWSKMEEYQKDGWYQSRGWKDTGKKQWETASFPTPALLPSPPIQIPTPHPIPSHFGAGKDSLGMPSRSKQLVRAGGVGVRAGERTEGDRNSPQIGGFSPPIANWHKAGPKAKTLKAQMLNEQNQ